MKTRRAAAQQQITIKAGMLINRTSDNHWVTTERELVVDAHKIAHGYRFTLDDVEYTVGRSGLKKTT